MDLEYYRRQNRVLRARIDVLEGKIEKNGLRPTIRLGRKEHFLSSESQIQKNERQIKNETERYSAFLIQYGNFYFKINLQCRMKILVKSEIDVETDANRCIHYPENPSILQTTTYATFYEIGLKFYLGKMLFFWNLCQCYICVIFLVLI